MTFPIRMFILKLADSFLFQFKSFCLFEKVSLAYIG
jgi:hypothetical protein